MYRLLKRFLDLLLASILIIITFPVIILLTVFLFIENNGHPFFYQLRPGYKGKPFRIIKFKTMNDKRDSNGDLLPDAQRLTRVGKFVRKTSLDELPQFFNVLMGQMSFVGPRPLLMEYLTLYSDFQKQRHLVKPGITGWAQINGRNAISWKERFELDVYYVNNISFMLDLKIIFRTIIKVIKTDGISAQGQATVENFKGNDS